MTWLDPDRDQNLPVVFHVVNRASFLLAGFSHSKHMTKVPLGGNGIHLPLYTFTYKNQAFMKVNIPIP